jgi:hypothetical protein
MLQVPSLFFFFFTIICSQPLLLETLYVAEHVPLLDFDGTSTRWHQPTFISCVCKDKALSTEPHFSFQPRPLSKKEEAFVCLKRTFLFCCNYIPLQEMGFCLLAEVSVLYVSCAQRNPNIYFSSAQQYSLIHDPFCLLPFLGMEERPLTMMALSVA